MPKLVIREFRIEDYDKLTDLWRAAGLGYRARGRDSRRQMERQLKHGNTHFPGRAKWLVSWSAQSLARTMAARAG